MIKSKQLQINPAEHANTWGIGQEEPSFKILPAHGFRGMAKARLRSYGLRKTRMRGVSFWEKRAGR